jgi:hypothetical protein
MSILVYIQSHKYLGVLQVFHLQLTAALTKWSSAFSTAVFLQQLFYGLRLTAAFPKITAQPNTTSVLSRSLAHGQSSLKLLAPLDNSSLHPTVLEAYDDAALFFKRNDAPLGVGGQHMTCS